MPCFSAASLFCHTSMKSTSIAPAYSGLSSSRMGAIILQGMHLPAPRSRSKGSFAPAVAWLVSLGAALG